MGFEEIHMATQKGDGLRCFRFAPAKWAAAVAAGGVAAPPASARQAQARTLGTRPTTRSRCAG